MEDTDHNLPGLFRHAVLWAMECGKQNVRVSVAEVDSASLVDALNDTHFMTQVNAKAAGLPCRLGFSGVEVHFESASALDAGVMLLEVF